MVKHTLFLLLIALGLAACKDLPIGPVDHACHTGGLEWENGQSGCSDWG